MASINLSSDITEDPDFFSESQSMLSILDTRTFPNTSVFITNWQEGLKEITDIQLKSLWLWWAGEMLAGGRGGWEPGESAAKFLDFPTPHLPALSPTEPESCSSVFLAFFYIFNFSLSAGLWSYYYILGYISSSSQIKTMPAPHTNCPLAPSILPTTTAIAFLFSHFQTLNKRACISCLPFLTSRSHSSPHPVSTFPWQSQTKLTHDHHCRIPNRRFNHVTELLFSTKHFDHSSYSLWHMLLLGSVLKTSWFFSPTLWPASQAPFFLTCFESWCPSKACAWPASCSQVCFRPEVLNLESRTSWCSWFWSQKPSGDFWGCYFSGEMAKALSRFPTGAVTHWWWNLIVLGRFTFCPGFIDVPQGDIFWILISSSYIFLKKDVSQPISLTVTSNSLCTRPNSLSSPETHQSFQGTKMICFSLPHM